ncbi:MAG: DinB family protein [Ginsengibacter sp.]
MFFQQQYEFVQSSRNVLLDYCSRISNEHFVVENSNFGRGSIRNLLVHIANTYEFWIGREALKKNMIFTEYASIKNIAAAGNFFSKIDLLIEEFINVYQEKHLIDIETEVHGKIMMASPYKLFTHVITHEFHHKGQILSLSRHLGYIPVDTDVVR